MDDRDRAAIPIDILIAGLSRPQAFPPGVRPGAGEVRVVQTHISAVFIAPRAVFKLKKPVDFGFLDFTTIEKRRFFCEEELRLNRRLSPGLYREVVPVVRRGDDIFFGGEGETVDWALRMDPLPEDRLLSFLLARDRASAPDMERVARAVAAFHDKAGRGEEITRIGGAAAVTRNTEENFSQIEPYVGHTVTRSTFDLIARYTRTFREVNAGLFAAREAGGFIRDGHGDLHSQHVCLTDPVLIFDCIEFSRRFRYCDVLGDASFLDMDLRRLGRADLADAFTRAYLAASGQQGMAAVPALYNFYRCYRAVVRGKVEGFRSRDPAVPADEAESARRAAADFFALAKGFARTLHPPTLFTLCGLMGSGKSSFARLLAERLDVVLVSSDLVRKELAGIAPTARGREGFGEGIYAPAMTERTYQALFDRARAALCAGRSTVIDASFTDPARRAQAQDLARSCASRHLLLYLSAPEGLLRERLSRRALKASVSDGRPEILPAQMAAFTPPDEVPAAERLVIDAAAGKVEKLEAAYRRALSTS
jgi:aminoglycoside phosphotransferase family enzyme/predicted kinase